jgi:hypothetical protein
MNEWKVFGIAIALWGVGLAALGQEIQSGPAVGKRIPGSFQPMNVTGEYAGKRHCLVCQNGDNPVAMVFARQADEPLLKLLKALDDATLKNSKKEMGSFAVFLSDSEELFESLKGTASKQGLKECVVAIDNPGGPQEYNIAKEAEVTVIFYNKQTVQANFVFRKGELNDKAIATIVKDLSKIVN